MTNDHCEIKKIYIILKKIETQTCCKSLLL